MWTPFSRGFLLNPIGNAPLGREDHAAVWDAGREELAVGVLQVGQRDFEALGGGLPKLVQHRPSGLVDGAPAEMRAARGEGAHARRDLVRVALDDLDLLERDLQLVGGDLREGRRVALALGHRAGEHRDTARAHLDTRKLAADPAARVDEGAHADPK